eukprot:7666229-Pyramimonas_sp.AAC.1
MEGALHLGRAGGGVAVKDRLARGLAALPGGVQLAAHAAHKWHPPRLPQLLPVGRDGTREGLGGRIGRGRERSGHLGQLQRSDAAPSARAGGSPKERPNGRFVARRTPSCGSASPDSQRAFGGPYASSNAAERARRRRPLRPTRRRSLTARGALQPEEPYSQRSLTARASQIDRNCSLRVLPRTFSRAASPPVRSPPAAAPRA